MTHVLRPRLLPASLGAIGFSASVPAKVGPPPLFSVEASSASVETLAEPEMEEVAEVATTVGTLFFLARTLGLPIPFLFFDSAPQWHS
jgi:hypothetical protein